TKPTACMDALSHPVIFWRGVENQADREMVERYRTMELASARLASCRAKNAPGRPGSGTREGHLQIQSARDDRHRVAPYRDCLGTDPGTASCRFVQALWTMPLACSHIVADDRGHARAWIHDAIFRLRLIDGIGVRAHRLVVPLLLADAWLARRCANRQ